MRGEQVMKEQYEDLKMEVIEFETEDVITESTIHEPIISSGF